MSALSRSIQGSRPRAALGSAARYAFVLFFVGLCLYPLVFMALTSIRTDEDYGSSAIRLPRSVRLENYAEAWTQGRMALLGRNTVVVTAITIVACILLGSMSAFATERTLGKRVGRLAYGYFVLGLIMPFQVLMIPLFKVLQGLELVNTFHGIILVYIALNLSFSVFVYAGFIRAIPASLIDAARIDGCGPLLTYRHVILPLCRTVSATVAIMTGMSVWKDLTVPLIYITNPALKTLSIGLFYFRNTYADRVPVMTAAMCVQTVPIILLFMSMQRHFIKGIASGAVKG